MRTEGVGPSLAIVQVPNTPGLSEKLRELTRPVTDTDECLLASAFYDGDLRVAVLKFYDQKAERFRLWRDNTGHRPYCYTRLQRDELGAISGRKDVLAIEEEERLDLLNDGTVKLRKIVTTDPLAIGGGNDSIRDRVKCWEADIKYYENYAYDRGLRMGTYYKVVGGNVVPSSHGVPDKVAESLREVTKKNPPEFAPYLSDWAELLGEPLCDFKRAALDIEVANEAGRLPDVEDPRQPVIAVSFFNLEEKLVYVLKGGICAGFKVASGVQAPGDLSEFVRDELRAETAYGFVKTTEIRTWPSSPEESLTLLRTVLEVPDQAELTRRLNLGMHRLTQAQYDAIFSALHPA